MTARAVNPVPHSTWKAQAGRWTSYELEASLTYTKSFRPAEAIIKNLSQKRNKNTKESSKPRARETAALPLRLSH